jgi:hypothetical protein
MSVMNAAAADLAANEYLVIGIFIWPTKESHKKTRRATKKADTRARGER